MLLFPNNLADKLLPIISLLLIVALVSLFLGERKRYLETKGERENLKQKIKEQSDHHKLTEKIILHSPDGILGLDEAGRITIFSPGLERITGYKKTGVIGLKADKIFRFKGLDGDLPIPEELFSDKHNFKEKTVKNTLVTKTENEINIEANCTLVHDKQTGQFEGIASIRKK